jgi:hypothetical protein
MVIVTPSGLQIAFIDELASAIISILPSAAQVFRVAIGIVYVSTV